ncbi:hypothetical protein FGO68_gene5280 [Halteria grandinella]|uniref:non-specific serine/threonine protein kinase n=1 Tax=Halteria grandinella TaxID=5974 RepID=A0A8J8NVE0_HALGN|nr:hypothetical protein FGO68_gene5280 [Halteria grandinella]
MEDLLKRGGAGQDLSGPTDGENALYFGGKFKQLSILGHGAYGAVYLVQRLSDKRKFAMKIIPYHELPNMAITPISDVEAAIQNFHVLCKKVVEDSRSFEWIVRLVDFYADQLNKRFFLLYDYADGGTLKHKIEWPGQRDFSEEQILKWFTQICLAVAELNKKKLFHLDLKPSNIFLVDIGDQKYAKVGDYHLLKKVSKHEKKVTGSPCYLPPEVFTNDTSPGTQAADSWALGLILYELCARKRAFEARSLGALALKIVDQPHEPIPDDRYSLEIQKLIDSLLSKKPSQRPTVQSVLESTLIRPIARELQIAPSAEGLRKQFEEKFGILQMVSSESYLDSLSAEVSPDRLGYFEEEESEIEKNMFDPEVVKKLTAFIEKNFAIKNAIQFKLPAFKFGPRPEKFKNGKTTMRAEFKDTDVYMYYGEMSTANPNKFCGKGIYIHKSNGLFHEGWYDNAMFNGYGRHVKDHSIYEGLYKDDNYDRGQMVVYTPNKFDILELKYMYLGEYQGTKREGYGVFIEKRGDMYYGYHEQSVMNGVFLGINNDGEKFIAFFEDNVLKKTIKFEK